VLAEEFLEELENLRALSGSGYYTLVVANHHNQSERIATLLARQD